MSSAGRVGSVIKAVVTPLRSSVIAVVLLGIVLAAGDLLHSEPANADPAGTVDEVAIDVDTTGNTATSLGAREACIQVSVGDTFDIDVTVKGIDPADQLLAFQYHLSYDPTKLKVIAVNHLMLVAASGGTLPIDGSDELPDTDGTYFGSFVDFGPNTESGDGVLSRITLESIGNGTSNMTLPHVGFDNAEFQPIQNIPNILNAEVAAGVTCSTTDVSLLSTGVYCPPNSSTGWLLVCTVDVAVQNNGPSTPVNVGGAVNVGIPNDCTVEDYTLKGKGFGTLTLDVSVSQTVSKDFTVSCSEKGLHQIVGCAIVQIRTDGVTDTNPYNDFATGETFIDIDGANLLTAGVCSTVDPPEVCGDGIDNDADTLVDEEPDTDGDGVSDCDDPDDDGDGFTDGNEAAMATDPLAACSASGAHPAWPPDFDNNRSVDIIDVLALKPVFGTPSPRHDLDASGGNIDIIDVLQLKPMFGLTCTQ